jgi:UDP-N-acetylmuramoylalanine--D-glutamate ligase
LILGGSEKHADFAELAAAIASADQVKAIALIGQTADRLDRELRAAGIDAAQSRSAANGPVGVAMEHCASLEEAVAFLLSRINKGAIALSPACASFGMFENYKERGKAFKKLVAGL